MLLHAHTKVNFNMTLARIFAKAFRPNKRVKPLEEELTAVVFFANDMSGLQQVFETINSLQRTLEQTNWIQLEWAIRAKHLQHCEHIECLLKHLYQLKQFRFPQLVININIHGLYSEDETTQWIFHLANTLEFQIQPSNTPAFCVRHGNTPTEQVMIQVANDAKMGKIGVYSLM